MLQARIRIDGREHLLTPEHDIEAIKQRITDQVRAGGGFVEIVSTPERTLEILISPGMNLSVDVVEVDDLPDSDSDMGRIPAAPSWLDTFDVF